MNASSIMFCKQPLHPLSFLLKANLYLLWKHPHSVPPNPHNQEIWKFISWCVNSMYWTGGRSQQRSFPCEGSTDFAKFLPETPVQILRILVGFLYRFFPQYICYDKNTELKAYLVVNFKNMMKKWKNWGKNEIIWILSVTSEYNYLTLGMRGMITW